MITQKKELQPKSICGPSQENERATFGEKLKNYFTELDFYRSKLKELPLGGDIFRNKNIWTLSVYLLASLGIFCRQMTNFPRVKINMANVQWNVLIASFIFGLAVLPFFIKRVNSINSEPGLQQVLTAFGVGFFMDFTTNAIINFYFP